MGPMNEIVPIEMDQFLSTVIQFKMDKMRPVQICASRLPGQYELSYCFAKDLDMWTLRLVVDENTPVPSITQMYPCAFLQENETAELFGVKIENIVNDYQNRLYRIDRETPFKEKG